MRAKRPLRMPALRQFRMCAERGCCMSASRPVTRLALAHCAVEKRALQPAQPPTPAPRVSLHARQ
eukprot:4774793-Pleurochrysis_carterae.AAC.1